MSLGIDRLGEFIICQYCMNKEMENKNKRKDIYKVIEEIRDKNKPNL